MAKEILPVKIQNQFDEFLMMIEASRTNALRKINKELVELYWELGKYISNRLNSADWGESIVNNLSKFLIKSRPELKGFDKGSLFRMRQFYETWEGNEKVATLWRQINWSSYRLILARKTKEEREFYLSLAANQNYSVRELERQIKTGLFERMLTSEVQVSLPAKEKYPNLENQFRDKYALEFLNLPDNHSEKDLRSSIVAHLKDFILEFGKDFAFMGDEYRVEVGGQDFYVDLLFFHRALKCLVAFELKIDAFKPQHLGQLSFYLKALDKNVKRSDENPSVGILLCKEKNDEVVEMSLDSTMSPTLVAEYKTKLIDTDLLQRKFHEILMITEKH